MADTPNTHNATKQSYNFPPGSIVSVFAIINAGNEQRMILTWEHPRLGPQKVNVANQTTMPNGVLFNNVIRVGAGGVDVSCYHHSNGEWHDNQTRTTGPDLRGHQYHWKVESEDYGDHDFNDLVIDFSWEEG